VQATRRAARDGQAMEGRAAGLARSDGRGPPGWTGRLMARRERRAGG
jgi:hypothetical protein